MPSIRVVPPSQSITICLVAANPDHSERLAQALRVAYISNPLVVFHDVQAALHFLLQADGSVEHDQSVTGLIIIDLNLPGPDVAHMLASVQSDDRTRHVPVMLLSTADAGQEVAQNVSHGGAVWVTPPLTHRSLAEALERLGLYFAVVMPEGTVSCGH